MFTHQFAKIRPFDLVLSWGVSAVLLQRWLPRLERPERSGGTHVGLLMVALN